MQKLVVPNAILLGEVERLVSEGNSVTLMTKGSSMLPFIRGGKDSVVLVAPGELHPGLIALAEVGEKCYVLHRIVSVSADEIVLMGDGNLQGYERCARKDIKAVATTIVKDGKEVDCLGKRHLRQARLWGRLLPVRRWLLAVYRRLPVKSI